ncbi:aminoacyl-tRNA deacylase [Oleiphilus sp. HI0071]|jgi:Cys-tRNA(Pro)/Cys-tRNA(Cys) deacylase|nr:MULTISPECIES: Cys-tRNA(Pro) deacylase [unclassified Oleiphilus]KZY58724.1 aminoacyl-tRNA deacylase [Oleiphilus sp. HI0065]KZY78016.1 aminoacyl-tRNA deacylase [Oleiphilus sp. HI0071]KZZ06061.1 aminoacyl-tRNA deacylase [Oleiphilus sp. HI0073]KZZ51381.1 aminoacyl-tRNA deacylase [Oleiphilus sp. HI0122]KZZ51547.1 aminoacyl-tRNA deacylase [Oleiphilus sp. HI0118]KZZ76331.1 aminoacyl-tRNA deacylase [Oleiphilus sp. HI0130]KZZ76813.1 aminoacyl-tRNA deacylase [Oleiphilus sp. HI0133]
MTPAINLLNKQKISHTVHAYEHDPNHGAYGLEAAEKLGFNPEKVFKTLIIELDASKLACVIIPVAESLNLKSAAKALGAKKASMAKVEDAERSTGYIKGGVSPFGQKKRLPTIVDASAEHLETLLVSGGRRGLDIEVRTEDLLKILRAKLIKVRA